MPPAALRGPGPPSAAAAFPKRRSKSKRRRGQVCLSSVPVRLRTGTKAPQPARHAAQVLCSQLQGPRQLKLKVPARCNALSSGPGGVLCFRDENCTHIRRLPRAPSLRCKNADAGQKMSQDLQGLASDTTLTIPDSKILLRAQEGSPQQSKPSLPTCPRHLRASRAGFQTGLRN